MPGGQEIREVEARFWCAAPVVDLRVADWGSLAAIHHVPSGKTHFINRSTLVLLTQVLRQARTARDAVECLAQSMAVDVDPQFVAEVYELLPRLDALGLVNRVAGCRASGC